MTDKEQIIIDGVEVLKEKINMCFILLLNKLETPETIEQTIYEHLDAFVKEWKLARKTQECEQKDKEVNGLNIIIDRLLEAGGYDKDISTAEDFEDVYSDIDYKVGLLEELKQECEELKKQLETSEKWRIEAESLNEKLDLKNTRYRKALEEIEEYAKENDDMLQGYHHEWANNKQILEIISKAKDGE